MEETRYKFEELQVYQKSLDFVDMVYSLTKTFPPDERFRLTSQYIRASISVSLNISEGAGDTNSQFQRFLKIALGSINECVVCSTIALRQGFITNEQDMAARKKLVEMSKMFTSLIIYLKRSTND